MMELSMKRILIVLAGSLALAGAASTVAEAREVSPPIIDMHLHATTAAENGPPPVGMCAPGVEFPTYDPARPSIEQFLEWLKNPPCENPVWSPETDEDLMRDTLEILERRNIYAITSGHANLVALWQKESPERIIPSLWFSYMLKSTPHPDEVRKLFSDGTYKVFSEVAIQYDGISPSDAAFEPYLALAEELDVPMGIHVGPGPPGVLYFPSAPEYRARLHSPLVLEEALARHPKLRVYIMHAAWPMLDDLIAVLYAHPRVYLDIGVISFILPRNEFHRYLRRIVEAGFGKRVMFGSDQMNWPATIEVAIDSIESASFLTAEQKRDIFYNNAARFLRLSDEEIAKHHQGL